MRVCVCVCVWLCGVWRVCVCVCVVCDVWRVCACVVGGTYFYLVCMCMCMCTYVFVSNQSITLQFFGDKKQGLCIFMMCSVGCLDIYIDVHFCVHVHVSICVYSCLNHTMCLYILLSEEDNDADDVELACWEHWEALC
jgi:hypothetical protein